MRDIVKYPGSSASGSVAAGLEGNGEGEGSRSVISSAAAAPGVSPVGCCVGPWRWERWKTWPQANPTRISFSVRCHSERVR